VLPVLTSSTLSGIHVLSVTNGVLGRCTSYPSDIEGAMLTDRDDLSLIA